jgi:phage terminase Nu1 subunit (DNA packaging protein)
MIIIYPKGEVVTDKKLAEIYKVDYRTLLNWKKNRPEVYKALHDALKFKELREEFCRRKE